MVIFNIILPNKFKRTAASTRQRLTRSSSPPWFTVPLLVGALCLGQLVTTGAAHASQTAAQTGQANNTRPAAPGPWSTMATRPYPGKYSHDFINGVIRVTAVALPQRLSPTALVIEGDMETKAINQAYQTVRAAVPGIAFDSTYSLGSLERHPVLVNAKGADQAQEPSREAALLVRETKAQITDAFTITQTFFLSEGGVAIHGEAPMGPALETGVKLFAEKSRLQTTTTPDQSVHPVDPNGPLLPVGSPLLQGASASVEAEATVNQEPDPETKTEIEMEGRADSQPASAPEAAPEAESTLPDSGEEAPAEGAGEMAEETLAQEGEVEGAEEGEKETPTLTPDGGDSQAETPEGEEGAQEMEATAEEDEEEQTVAAPKLQGSMLVLDTRRLKNYAPCIFPAILDGEGNQVIPKGSPVTWFSHSSVAKAHASKQNLEVRTVRPVRVGDQGQTPCDMVLRGRDAAQIREAIEERWRANGVDIWVQVSE